MTEDNPFFFIFIGVLTGVGGGVVRDIMAGETPYILVREIYASASIAGGIVYIACRNSVGEPPACFWVFVSPWLSGLWPHIFTGISCGFIDVPQKSAILNRKCVKEMLSHEQN